jgi:hypothetical protein
MSAGTSVLAVHPTDGNSRLAFFQSVSYFHPAEIANSANVFRPSSVCIIPIVPFVFPAELPPYFRYYL